MLGSLQHATRAISSQGMSGPTQDISNISKVIHPCSASPGQTCPTFFSNNTHTALQPTPAPRLIKKQLLLQPPAAISSADMFAADCPEPCVADLQFLDMPPDLMTMILQHVPLQQRLGVCTRVCHAFRTAAVAATDNISITRISSQEQSDNVSEWLQLHCGGVTCLDIQAGHDAPLASLPCPALRTLNLRWLSVQPGFVSTCTILTRLKLNCCCVQSSPHASSSVGSNPLTQLSVLIKLQHLDLYRIRLPDSVTHPGAYVPLPRDLLSQLVQLTCLKLYSQLLSDAALLKHVTALSALQHLELDFWAGSQQQLTAAELTGLQQLPQLTALKLFNVRWPIDLHSMPAFAVLTALRVLELEGSTSVDPAVLAAISQLQHVDWDVRHPWDAEGSAAFLAAIGQQQDLISLRIYTSGYPCGFGDPCWSAPSPAAYSALTASSHLQHLELIGCDFPAGAWQLMFPPTRCFTELRHLRLGNHWAEVQLLSQADVQAMASLCRGLVTLQLGRDLPVSSATPLQQLTGLTTLHMCASFQDSAPSIAQLTELQDLLLISCEQADQVTVSGLLQFTALQQLRKFDVGLAAAACELGLRSLVVDRVEGVNDSCLVVSNKAPEGAAPDVWQQLRSLCEAAGVAD